jgi:hypothetical protein
MASLLAKQVTALIERVCARRREAPPYPGTR